MEKRGKRPGADVRKKDILNAATEVFGEKNYHWATTKEIAERAGITERVIFLYFNTKKDLYKAVIQKAFEDLTRALMRGQPPVDDLRAFLKMGARNYITFLENNMDQVKILAQAIDIAGDPELGPEFGKLADAVYRGVNEVLKAARRHGEISEDMIETTAAVIAGVFFIVAYAEILKLDWFRGEREDIMKIADHYADLISGR